MENQVNNITLLTAFITCGNMYSMIIRKLPYSLQSMDYNFLNFLLSIFV